ncbi:MAG: SulP family inorganic anion transporter [Actinomycetes bacterium]
MERWLRTSRIPGIGAVTRRSASADVVAGLTLAALGIPEVIGYAQLAHMPLETGLATMILPITVFALLGSSRHLVVGADSATAVIMAAALLPLAPAASPEYVALAGVLAIMTGLFLVLGRVLRLGFLADFLSRSVLIGFLTGVGIQVAWKQLPTMLDVSSVVDDLADISWTTAGFSAAIVAFVIGARRISRRFPAALIAVVVTIVLGRFANLDAHGISLLGPVPAGLPSIGLPRAPLADIATLWATAGAMFLVILAQSAGTSRAYAARYRERVDENRDVLALGAANLVAGLGGTFAVNGSPTKTEMVDGAGGRSQLAMLTTAGVVLLVILVATKPLSYLPNCALASVVFVIGLELVDIAGMRRVLRMRRDEFVVAALTAAMVVFWGVEQGIVLAIVLSIIDHLRRSYRPVDTLIVRDERGHFTSVPVSTGRQIDPGICVYHFAASVYYANAEHFRDEVLGLLGAAPAASTPVHSIVLDAGGIADVDYSGGQMLVELLDELTTRGVRVVVANVAEPVVRELERYGAAARLGDEPLHDTVIDALAALRGTT